MKKIIPLSLAVVLGLLQAVSYAPVPMGVLQIISMAGLLVLLRQTERPSRAVFAFGLAWFGAGMYWLHFSIHGVGGLPSALSVLAVALLAGYLTLFYVGALSLWRRFLGGVQPSLVSHLLALPACWLAAELARGYFFGGLPWLASGYAHVDNPLLKGWFAVLGVYGVGFFAAMCAGGMALMVEQVLNKNREVKRLVWTGFTVAALFVVGLILQGISWSDKHGAPLSVELVQPNVAQTIKFDENEIIRNSNAFLTQATQSRAALTVFPETALPLPWVQVKNIAPETLGALQNSLNNPNEPLRAVLMGGVGIDASTQSYFNSGLWLTRGSDFDSPQRFDKIHLMQFGEVVPWGFGWFVKALNIPLGGYAYGQSRTPFVLKNGATDVNIGVNICYENEFGEELAQAWANGDKAAPNVIVNLTNLGWFGKMDISTAQTQHLQMARARALEMARPIIVATNTGASAHIDASGVVVNQLEGDAATKSMLKVQPMSGETPFVLWGNAPLFALISGLFGLAVFMRHRYFLDV